ncbi:Na(+)-translocating NADH-quinone reductase subunit A [Tropicimonas isoalkanivorans]|uniref:Na+-transporting NADH:ubiquinone oxidoreductase subunit A n=1 Tax=Tropicimonas isoalkanivorans TaxID=441112 RepID=A0A1I1QY92_9RHOB|nr:Na(+)-translocating NADH-quinone reductase subunit A [Tropicimonas isoalkanivorans]SFD26957.1 Na+-transporting NADH:ubiquinone oxidoreductase subunit A [Tropicimonas isoalkanivorans]
MLTQVFSGGLTVPVPTAAPERNGVDVMITEEAAITALPEDDFRVEPLVDQGDSVEQGAPVLRSRRHHVLLVTAPMPGRVASIELGPGHRLSSIRFFLEPEAGRREVDTHLANRGDDPGALRDLLLGTGLWRFFRARPFGQVPLPTEHPSAIFVMAVDTRPRAPSPREAISGRAEAFERGLHALLRMTEGPVFLCQDGGRPVLEGVVPDRLRPVSVAATHPWGLAGLQIHRLCPAEVGTPVWDIHAEDVAAIGSLLETGRVPETRLVSIAGPALRQAREVRCQPGADLRELCHGIVAPGPHTIVSGSALDGREAHWLRHRDRQVTVLGGKPKRRAPHWFLSALETASRPKPLIPTAALDQALGGDLPAAPFLRALTSGDTETFRRLGGLSFVEEDLALADYITGAAPSLRACLSALLHRIAVEEAA